MRIIGAFLLSIKIFHTIVIKDLRIRMYISSCPCWIGIEVVWNTIVRAWGFVLTIVIKMPRVSINPGFSLGLRVSNVHIFLSKIREVSEVLLSRTSLISATFRWSFCVRVIVIRRIISNYLIIRTQLARCKKST